MDGGVTATGADDAVIEKLRKRGFDDAAAHAVAAADVDADLVKSVSTETVEFEARVGGAVGPLYKADGDGDYVIWGAGSVEMVDKEDDRITADALEDALPQLRKRARLSYEHRDQLVGKILEEFKTAEPTTVEVGGNRYTRTRFPTDVLKLSGLPRSLFVAGKVYGDSRKAREVRKAIDDGDINSFSISGDALKSRMVIEDGEPVTEITKLDLSAVTLCREGMNPQAKFGVVRKVDDRTATAGVTPGTVEKHLQRSLGGATAPSDPSDGTTVTHDRAAALLKSTMGDTGDGDGEDPLTESQLDELMHKHLDDVPTEDEVRALVQDEVEKAAEGMEQPEEEDVSDETGSGSEGAGDGTEGGATHGNPEDEAPTEKGVFTDEQIGILKAALPTSAFKRLAPVLKMGEDADLDAFDGLDEEEPEDGDVDVVEPGDELDDVEPDGEEDEFAMKARALGLDPGDLSVEERIEVAKADVSEFQTAGGASAPKSAADGAHDEFAKALGGGGDNDQILEKAEGNTPSGSQFFDADGGVQL